MGKLFRGRSLDRMEENLKAAAVSASTAQQPAASSPKSAPSRTVYVPAYSHVYSHGGLPYLLEVTLSVRNTDSRANLTLTRADYFDTEGKLLRRYIKAPMQLAPLQAK